jgi:hypothetical protein
MAKAVHLPVVVVVEMGALLTENPESWCDNR